MKNIVIISLLLSLVGWGVYDHYNKNKENETVEIKMTAEGESQLTKDEAQMASSTEVGLKQGNLAPNFELKTLDGETIKLSDYKGKKVILNFWASWCPPCKAEMPHMQDFYEEQESGKGDVEILAVNLRNLEKNGKVVRKFVEDYKLTFPILLDTEDVGTQYQAFTIPTSYALDTKGVIQYKIVGPMSKEIMEKMMHSIN
jgi:peroxiredoxin